MELFKLFGSIMVDNDKANASIAKTDNHAKSLGKRFSDGAVTIAKWGAALGGAAIAGGAAILAVANKTAEAGDRIDKLSQKIGLSRQGFQEWEFILSQSGTSIEGLQGGFKKFVDVVDNANAGNKLAVAQMKELGLTMEEVGKLSPEELFNRTIVALQGMEEGTHKSALANDLLGRSASELAPLINGAVGSVEEMRAKANELGLVISDDVVNASVKWTDTMDQLKRTFGAFVTNLGAEALPYLQQFGEYIQAHMPEIEATVKLTFNTIYDAITGTINAVKELTKWFEDNWNVLQPILAGIAAGATVWGLYTLAINAASIATTVWTTVTSVATAVGAAFGAVLAFVTSPIGLVVIAIGLLVAAGVALYQNWETVSEFLSQTWKWIKETATNVFNSILDFFSEYGLLILGIITGPAGWATLLGTYIYQNWDKIKAFTINIFTSIKNWIVDIFTQIGTFLKGLAGQFLQIGKDIFNNMWDGLKSVWSSISSWINDKINWLKEKLTFWKSSQSTMSSGSSGIEARATGGSVNQGQPYLVGEKGAELFVPNQAGTIIPNSQLTGSSSSTKSVVVNINGATIFNDSDADRLGDMLVGRLRALGVT